MAAAAEASVVAASVVLVAEALAVVVQADRWLQGHPSVTLCPLTSTLRQAPLVRIAVEPSLRNGLHKPSQLMVDKLFDQYKIEVLGFDVERDAFGILPLRAAHAHHVVPLGMANEQFYVASFAPTNEELQHQLCTQTGHTVRLVWASRDAIERRLELQDRIEHAGHAHSPSAIVDDVRRRMLPPQAMQMLPPPARLPVCAGRIRASASHPHSVRLAAPAILQPKTGPGGRA